MLAASTVHMCYPQITMTQAITVRPHFLPHSPTCAPHGCLTLRYQTGEAYLRHLFKTPSSVSNRFLLTDSILFLSHPGNLKRDFWICTIYNLAILKWEQFFEKCISHLARQLCHVQAYAAARMTESILRGLDGEQGIFEAAYVESNVTELPFFASKVRLGPSGVEEVQVGRVLFLG